jgi:broad specificity phosphatase PhoE
LTGCILLVRHGETEWNLQRRYQGRSDSPLTERGLAQADAIGRFLHAFPDAASARIVASPLGRARRTAEIIHRHFPAAPPPQFDDRLRELSLGSWDGLTYGEIAARCPGVFDRDGRYNWYFRAPDGERYDALMSRLREWLRERDSAGVLVVVTHGIVTRVLRGLYVGLARETALTLPVPQDKVFRLSDGAIEELPVRPPYVRSAADAADHGETLHGATSKGRSR